MWRILRTIWVSKENTQKKKMQKSTCQDKIKNKFHLFNRAHWIILWTHLSIPTPQSSLAAASLLFPLASPHPRGDRLQEHALALPFLALRPKVENLHSDHWVPRRLQILLLTRCANTIQEQLEPFYRACCSRHVSVQGVLCTEGVIGTSLDKEGRIPVWTVPSPPREQAELWGSEISSIQTQTLQPGLHGDLVSKPGPLHRWDNPGLEPGGQCLYSMPSKAFLFGFLWTRRAC